MFDNRVIKVIEDCLPNNQKHLAETISKALWTSGLVTISHKWLEEQELNVYSWTVVESDGYMHKESGIAMNMMEAFIKATEYSPSFHNSVEIAKVPRENLSESQKGLLSWYTEEKDD